MNDLHDPEVMKYIIWCEGRLKELAQVGLVEGRSPLTEKGWSDYRALVASGFVPTREKMIWTLETNQQVPPAMVNVLATLMFKDEKNEAIWPDNAELPNEEMKAKRKARLEREKQFAEAVDNMVKEGVIEVDFKNGEKILRLKDASQVESFFEGQPADGVEIELSDAAIARLFALRQGNENINDVIGRVIRESKRSK